MTSRRKFKFKPTKIAHSDLRAELEAMGNDASWICCAAINDGGEFTVYDIEDANGELTEARNRILRRQEDAQFNAFWDAQQ